MLTGGEEAWWHTLWEGGAGGGECDEVWPQGGHVEAGTMTGRMGFVS